MNSFFRKITIAAHSALIATTGLSAGSASQDGEWDFGLEFLYLWQDTDGSRFGESNTGTTFRADAAELGWGPGARATIEKRFEDGLLTENDALQFQGMYVYHDGKKTYTAGPVAASFDFFDSGPGTDLLDQGDPWSTSTTTTIAVDRETHLWGLELNWICDCLNPMDVYVGPRFIYFSDCLDITVNRDDFFGAPLMGFLNNETSNALIGAQIGARREVELNENFHICGSIEGGLFANFAERDLAYQRNDGAFDVFRVSTSDTQFAGVIEGNAKVCYHASEGINLCASATVIYLGGIATAADAIPKNDGSVEVRKSPGSESILYAGFSVGGEATF